MSFFHNICTEMPQRRIATSEAVYSQSQYEQLVKEDGNLTRSLTT